jgi:quercetin dioxygenase-like cupin family protein
MTGLAGPSQGAGELSSWRVRMQPGSVGPLHAIDREQIWMPVTGELVVTSGGVTETVAAGQAVVFPAGELRQVAAAADGPAEALVCMPVGGRAVVPGVAESRPLPWAE